MELNLWESLFHLNQNYICSDLLYLIFLKWYCLQVLHKINDNSNLLTRLLYSLSLAHSSYIMGHFRIFFRLHSEILCFMVFIIFFKVSVFILSGKVVFNGLASQSRLTYGYICLHKAQRVWRVESQIVMGILYCWGEGAAF